MLVKRRSMASLGALLLALAMVAVPPAPPASAAPAPWHWVRVRDHVPIAPHGYYSIREFCPSGYTAITGGLQLPIHSRVQRGDEYRFDDGAGSSWFVTFENTSPYTGDAWVVAECVLTTDLPAMSHNYVQVPTSGDYGVAGATVWCLNEGEVVLTGGASWSNVNTRTLSTSGPGSDGRSWHAGGTNTTPNSLLAIEVYCVDPAAVPGYVAVERLVSGEYSWEASVSCPPGTRILNGGSDTAVFASYPTLNKWTATNSTDYSTYDVRFRAWCVNAGAPTIIGFLPSPGPDGAVTNDTHADFELDATDPAGFSELNFRCSLDNHAPVVCYGPYYPGLADGPHQFVTFAETPDGRLSPTITYRWTVDATPPTVQQPSLPRVSLANPVRATWRATDATSGVARFEAAYWRAKADGTLTAWTQPSGWDSLSTPTVRLPNLAPGDTICVSVRARDQAGNVAPWTAPRCTSRPYDDAVLTASSRWVRDTGTQYWLGTVSRTPTQSETLRRSNVRTRLVGIVATRCPGCGTVQVAVAGQSVGTINLEAATTQHQQVLLLPAFPLRTGAVVLTVATAGKSVRIDGLVTINYAATGPP
jgi:hypothetical protein